MADAIVITVLAYLHVFFAIGWYGGAVLFLSVIAPGLRTVSPRSFMEFLAKVGPRATRFFTVGSTLTIVFGLVLLFYSGVNNTPVYIGAGLGLVAYLVAIAFTVPALNKADKLAELALGNPQGGPPPPEMLAAVKRGGMGIAIVVALLTITVAFMVISGFYF